MQLNSSSTPNDAPVRPQKTAEPSEVLGFLHTEPKGPIEEAEEHQELTFHSQREHRDSWSRSRRSLTFMSPKRVIEVMNKKFVSIHDHRSKVQLAKSQI